MSLVETRCQSSPLDRFGFARLDEPSAAYFVETLCLARNARERAWCHLLESLPTALRVRVLRARQHPRRGQWPTATRMADLQRRLDDLNAEDGPVREAIAASAGRIVMAVPGRDGQIGAVVFLFTSGDRAPAAVLKLRPAETGGVPVSREARALRTLARVLPATLRATVPGVLACGRIRDTDLLLLTGIPGRSAYVDLHRDLMPRRRVATHFQHAARWLAQFHLATSRAMRPVDARELDRTIARALAMLRAAPGSLDLSWVPELRRLSGRTPLLAVACHGDFWARNLVIASSPVQAGDVATGVVDWEHFRPRALPSEDLFQFPLTYGLAFPWSRYRRADAPHAFQRTFVEDNEVSREVARYLQTYCARTALSPAMLKPLLRLFLLTRAALCDRAGADNRTPWLAFDRLIAAAGASVVDSVTSGGTAV